MTAGRVHLLRKIGWPGWLGCAAVTLALALIVWADGSHASWVARVSAEGSAPPKHDPESITGYVQGQRHLLAPYQRGETYRWIAATQEFVTSGPWASPTYAADSAPEGRPQLLSKLYTGWLALVAGGLHVFTGTSLPLAVEQTALCEPVISHLLALIAAATFMGMRYGALSAGATALFFALFPPVFGQFLPGALTAGTWALLFATYAIAVNLPGRDKAGKNVVCSVRSAVAASIALWLDPAFGVPAVLLTAAAGAGMILTQRVAVPYLRWSLLGSGITLAAWLIDQAPWNPAAGELRYVHPLYALAWLGLGLALDGWQQLRTAKPRHARHWARLIVALPLISALVFFQLRDGYKGWLYPSAAIRRLTSLVETTAFNSAFDWFARVSSAEVAFLLAPVLAAIVTLADSLRKSRDSREAARSLWVPAAVVLGGVVAFALFRVRWSVAASLIALPLIGAFTASATAFHKRTVVMVAAAFFVGLLAWGKSLPASFQRPPADSGPRPGDLEALVYRHFAHWLASHHPDQPVIALAPPELSDSLVFHGGSGVLMSTAWESYRGHVAAARVLSAPESSEAEAVMESLGVTHIILPSWDQVLPRLVRAPAVEGKDTLHARLERWLMPPYLRPVPYRLPPVPGYLDQKLAVFKVAPAQDEALQLSRLAEYFLEMERPEPAGLVAKILTESFPDDPNATIARAFVHVQAKDQTAFGRELERMAADVTAGKTPFGWDRRVQRAIVLALGRKGELARAEIEACIATMSRDGLFDLTPLQAHRLGVLARSFGITIADDNLAKLLASLGREYATAAPSPATR